MKKNIPTFKGKKHSVKTKMLMSALAMGKNNSQWKGDDVGYEALHRWVRDNKPKKDFCECCNLKTPYDLANISQQYHRDINDFEWLCRSCHMRKDKRIKNLKQFNIPEFDNRDYNIMLFCANQYRTLKDIKEHFNVSRTCARRKVIKLEGKDRLNVYRTRGKRWIITTKEKIL